MSEKLCPLCGEWPLKRPESIALGACSGCRRTRGIVAPPPSRRPPAPCQRCNAMRFVRVVTHQRIARMATVGPVPFDYGHGQLDAFICKKCGFVEWYCNDVDSIPIHAHLGTEDVDYEPDTPYR